ncbi:MAG TPA: hypothetical protein VGW38_04730, partial [Chloroflexota bacterium]|nr:hypothetical protein [Chloroflexota bacterium]
MVAQDRPLAAPGDDGQAVSGPPTNLIVPECPVLAPAVELVGELRGSGYEARQWLVQRDGHFVQVSELLYRVVEQVNGERTLDEIAANVTASTDWLVTADDVRRIIHSKLVPMGLIALVDGQQTAVGRRPMHSALMVSARAQVFGPRVIEPVAGVLQVLYARPVLILMLAAIVVGHVWLYAVHGVASSARDVLQTPGLFLIVLAILLGSAVFHEFGHAAALRHGGGKVRGMG